MPNSEPILLRKKEEYDLSEVFTFREMIRFVDRDKLREFVKYDEVYSWEEIDFTIVQLLNIPPAPTEQLLVITETDSPIMGTTVVGSVCLSDDLLDTHKWRRVGVDNMRDWLDAKVVSLRGVGLSAHHIVARLLYSVAWDINNPPPPPPPM